MNFKMMFGAIVCLIFAVWGGIALIVYMVATNSEEIAAAVGRTGAAVERGYDDASKKD